MTKSNDKTVYHYTCPQGAFSILSNKTIWFTEVQYLNDRHEHAINDDGKRRYVFCASRSRDNLTMWNYYVKNGDYRGYNLGINVEAFTRLLKRDIANEKGDITLIPDEITYSDDAKRDDAKRDVFSKQKAFECENEYRFVIEVPSTYKFRKQRDRALQQSGLTLKHRVSASGIIVPYLEWHFNLKTKQELFTTITLAPMIEEALATASFKQFLHKDVYNNISIEPSSLCMKNSW
ncbi:MAG: hypothetical protein ACRCUY_08490 [Thermoguttaceae bacterium]